MSGEDLASRWWRALQGVLLGALTAFPALREKTAVRRTERQLNRIARYSGPVETEPLTPERCLLYLTVRSLVGVLGGGVLLMLFLGSAAAVSMVTAWAFNGSWSVIEHDDRVSTALLLTAAVPGVPLLFGTMVGVVGVSTVDRELAARMLGPSQEVLLRRRVDEVIDAITDERRRIERDLHDGVQQRLVAVGVLIGRARRAEEPADLLRQAHLAAQDAIADLREVASRVYPAALDADGLPAALESLAERASVDVRLSCDLADPGASLATVIYFVVSESLTNAAKHAEATRVEVTVTKQAGNVVVRVRDDGRGGANPDGTGLAGLWRRVRAAGGTFTVHSPVGGPTTVEATLPCA